MNHRIAVIGSGPRGMMVVERLAVRLAQRDGGPPVDLYVIDAVEVGCGRIYRTDQPDWFLMNTVAGQISAFSGLPDEGRARPGAGPSFVQWWSSVDPDYPGPDSYAPRGHYGRYLRFVLDAIEAGLPERDRMHRVRASVADLERADDGYLLTFADGSRLSVDKVVLVTGHSRAEPVGEHQELADFAASRPHLRYLAGDSTADLPLADIPAGTGVGVVGLGLSFYDVMAAFTIGRGGTFTDDGSGGLRYLPSGREPRLVAGSRSGMPLPARGRNQKPGTYSYPPVLFTPERVRRGLPGGQLDFTTEVLPWLLGEVDLVYYASELRRRRGAEAARAFTAEVAAADDANWSRTTDLVAQHGLADLPRVDLDRWARPFAGRSFDSVEQFESALVEQLRSDLAEAEQGNVDNPVKAALDVLRDCRWAIRELVDFAGLTPASHRDDFLGWYVPRASFLAAGPPRVRLLQTMALIDAGVLRVIGPDASFTGDPERDRFVVSSPRVADADVPVDVVIDARIPTPHLGRDLSPLTRRLRERGIWTSYRNGAFDTGGVAVTDSPFHPIGVDGTPDTGLCVLGIPTEHTRWFMQVGSSRPGMWSDFVRNADDIAAHALVGVGTSLEVAV